MAGRRTIDFRPLEKLIQDYANTHFNGNFTAAVKHLTELGLFAEQLAEGKKR